MLTTALAAGTTRLPEVAQFLISQPLEIRVSFALAFVALVMVAIAENARIPVDNPATHLELTMVHEAMVLEYSGRHLARDRGGELPETRPLYIADHLPVRSVRHGTAPR